MAFKALLFDIGDTLWHSAEAPPAAEFRRIAAQRARAFLAGQGIACANPEQVARIAWNALESAMKHARSTNRVEPDYAAVAQAALKDDGLSLTRAQANGLMEAIYISGEDGGKSAYPDAVPTLHALRERGFRLGIVTNRAFGGARFRDDLRAAGLDVGWDACVVSVEAGYLKPHPAIFELALAELEIEPSEALMVGNSLLEDIGGAQALGIRAAWKRSVPDADGITPDFVFDDVSELLEWAPLKVANRG
jgi:HAD superfamily hydrolase (TIGR01549 family)